MGGLAEIVLKDRRDFLKRFGYAAVGVGFGNINNNCFVNFVVNKGETDATPEECQELKKELEYSTCVLSDVVGRRNLRIKDGTNIKVNFIKNGSAITTGGKNPTILIPVFSFRNQMSPAPHEAVHAIAPNGDGDLNYVFGEGLATYFQNKYAKIHIIPDFGMPIDAALLNESKDLYQKREIIMTLDEAISCISLTAAHPKTHVSPKEWVVSYLTSASFTQFMIEEFFKKDYDKFMPLYYKCRKKEDLLTIGNLNPDKLEKDWKESVMSSVYGR